MIQELVTYFIIVSAILAALRLIFKKPAGKRQRKNSCAEPRHDTCSKCPAECILRDLQYIKKDETSMTIYDTNENDEILRVPSDTLENQ